MSKYIKFDDAVKVMACEMYAEAQSQGYDVDGIEDFMPEAKAWLNDAPSINIEPKRGEWVNTAPSYMSDNIICDQCGYNSIARYDYCPNCGADMREREGE